MKVNWELEGCCDHDQRIFLAAIGVSTVVILLLWRTFLLTPFKLITVFLHETSHALACKLTCGDAYSVNHVIPLDTGIFIKEPIITDVFSGSINMVKSIDRWTAMVVSMNNPVFNRCMEHFKKAFSVEGMQVHANEGGSTQTRGGIYWIILPAGYLGSSFWGMVFILASTNLLTTRIAAGCFILALFVVLFVAKNWFLRWLCLGFIVFLAVAWVIQEFTKFHSLKYVILFIGVMNSLFSVYDIYDDLISRRVNSSDAEKFAEICPCPCNGCAWGVIWGFISFVFLSASIYLGLVILS